MERVSVSQVLRILVIDDNDFIRLQIVKFLQDDGYETIEAASVSHALNVVKTESHMLACVIVDVRMEPMDGFNFLNKIRAEGIEIPAILVTGDQNSDILAKASEYGVHSVLMKPVNKDRLLQMIARAIPGANKI